MASTGRPLAHDGREPCWQLDFSGENRRMVLAGDWIARLGRVPRFSEFADGVAPGGPIRFEASALGSWDTGLIAFLWDVKRAADKAGVALDASGLPEAAGKLLNLLSVSLAEPPRSARRRVRPLHFIGGRMIAVLTDIGVVAGLLTATLKGAALAMVGRARMRGIDLLSNVRDAGPSALLIVSVVNFLIGAILAFVGAVQLRKFAADIYVANLVGLALVREMAAVMTAIVVAGRTGGAYAARIATMQGNEEIDALTVIGIPVSDYLVLPAVLSLVITMPFLYLYGCLIGILGGFVVSTAMLNITGAGYLQQTLAAVPFSQFVFGFLKTIAFALLIGVASCHIGLQAGRSSADVGTAATRAVVVGIVGVIAMDAVFAVIADVIGI